MTEDIERKFVAILITDNISFSHHMDTNDERVFDA